MNVLRLQVGLSSDVDLLVDIDNDASTLFDTMGLRLDAASEREITAAARSRWALCLASGAVLIAVDPSGEALGFAALGQRDREPYLDQLSVCRRAMGQGIGTALLRASIDSAAQARGHSLWLTTYTHVRWNRPFYERHGFAAVPLNQCGEEMQRELLSERGLLPDPDHRVPMRRALAGKAVPGAASRELAGSAMAFARKPPDAEP